MNVLFTLRVKMGACLQELFSSAFGKPHAEREEYFFETTVKEAGFSPRSLMVAARNGDASRNAATSAPSPRPLPCDVARHC